MPQDLCGSCATKRAVGTKRGRTSRSAGQGEVEKDPNVGLSKQKDSGHQW